MDLIGQCSICGSPAYFTCIICGQMVCERHYDRKSKMCSNCSPSATMKREKDDREEDKLLR
ncbi:MAG TPA: hypothetical protein VGK23_07600 [Methanomassiliicoccales archaeon]